MFACLHSFNKFIGDLFYHTFPYAVGHFWFPFIADKKLRVKTSTKCLNPDHRQPRIQTESCFLLIQFNDLCLFN